MKVPWDDLFLRTCIDFSQESEQFEKRLLWLQKMNSDEKLIIRFTPRVTLKLKI